MNTKLALGLSALLLTNMAVADTISVEAGATYWQYDIDGYFNDQSANFFNNIDIKEDLGYDDDNVTSFYILIEHPMPFLPNIRLQKTDLDSAANGVLRKNISIGGITFPISAPVTSLVSLKTTDVTLYWQVLDNVVDLDIGFNAKYVDGKTSISGNVGNTGTADFSGWVPMLYVGGAANLPLTGLSVGAYGNWIGYQGNNFYDVDVHVKYKTPWFIGVMAGYRSMNLELDDFDNFSSDLTFEGPYAGLYAKF